REVDRLVLAEMKGGIDFDDHKHNGGDAGGNENEKDQNAAAAPNDHGCPLLERAILRRNRVENNEPLSRHPSRRRTPRPPARGCMTRPSFSLGRWPPLGYVGGALDRAAERRGDIAFIAAAERHPGAGVYAISGEVVVLARRGETLDPLLAPDEARGLGPALE